MAKQFEIYKCDLCGNVFEVITAGSGVTSCCGKEMKLLAENTVDASKEKHVPVVQKTPDGIMVNVGSVAHPMDPDHYIQWIEVLAPHGQAYMHLLKPGEKPQAAFPVKPDGLIVREYCNKHGVWKA